MSTAGKVALAIGVVCTVLVVISWIWVGYMSSQQTVEMEADMARLLQQLDKLSVETEAQPCGRCEAELAHCRMMLEDCEDDASSDAGQHATDAADGGAR